MGTLSLPRHRLKVRYSYRAKQQSDASPGQYAKIGINETGLRLAIFRAVDCCANTVTIRGGASRANSGCCIKNLCGLPRFVHLNQTSISIISLRHTIAQIVAGIGWE